MKYAIVNADDFGLSSQVNRAIIRAHTEGILTSASLMISAPFAGEAVRLARKHPRLRVGLHLVLVDGVSVLPRSAIPRLVDAERRFTSRPARAGFTYFFSAQARREVALECEAQLQAFLKTGLTPDHVNSHHHLHIHPVIAAIVLARAREYAIPVRLPLQGPGLLRKHTAPMAAAMFPWTLWLRQRLRGCGIAHNQAVCGLYESGCLDEDHWLRLIPRLKPGISEIFCHPALPAGDVAAGQPTPGVAEFRALISERVKSRLRREHIRLTTFSRMAGEMRRGMRRARPYSPPAPDNGFTPS